MIDMMIDTLYSTRAACLGVIACELDPDSAISTIISREVIRVELLSLAWNYPDSPLPLYAQPRRYPKA